MNRLANRVVVISAVTAFLVSLCPLGSAEAVAAPKFKLVVEDVGFATPECVLYYAEEDVYLVSNINGSPLEADGNGFISKIAPDGTVVSLKWIDGTADGIMLDAPKGMAIQNNTLYVADLSNVRLFALPSGKLKKTIKIPDSTFLNDVGAGPKGSVFVSDSGLKGGPAGFVPTGTDAIYKIKRNNKVSVYAKDEALGGPNGVFSVKGGVLIVTFGSSELYRVDSNGKRHDVTKPPKGSLDGIIRMNDGRLLISSWEGSALYTQEKDGSFKIAAEGLDSPADIGYDTKRDRVLVPLFQQNKVVVLEL